MKEHETPRRSSLSASADARGILLRQLSQQRLFLGLPTEQLAALAGIAQPRAYTKGQQIFREGDVGSGFHVIRRGCVKIYKLSPEGKEQILHLFGPGESFGEASVFAGQGFPASAEAASASHTLYLPRSGFLTLIRKDPSLAMNMIALLSLRLREFTGLIEDLSLKEVPGRLAAYVLFLADRQGGDADVVLDMTKKQLSAFLGTIPETLSRILKRMAASGLIALKGSRIGILDLPGVEAIACGEKLPPRQFGR